MLISREALTDAVRVLGMATASDIDTPEYGFVHIETFEKGGLILSCTDGVLGANVFIPPTPAGVGSDERIRCSVGIAYLSAAVRSSTSDTVEIKIKDKATLEYKSGTFKTRMSTRNYLDQVGFKINLNIEPEERIQIAEIPYGELAVPLGAISWLASEQNTNAALADVHLVNKGEEVLAVASDGISMFIHPTPFVLNDFSGEYREEGKLDLALSSRFVSAFERLGVEPNGRVRLYMNEHRSLLAFSIPGRLQITTALKQAKFPNFHPFLAAKENTVRYRIEKKELSQALGQFNALMAADRSKESPCCLTFEHGALSLTSLKGWIPVETSLLVQQEDMENIPPFNVDVQQLSRGLRNVSGNILTVSAPRSLKEPLYLEGDRGEVYLLMQRR